MKIVLFVSMIIVVYILVGWTKNDYVNPLVIYKQSKVAKAINKTVNNLYEKKIITLNNKYLSVLKITLAILILFAILRFR